MGYDIYSGRFSEVAHALLVETDEFAAKNVLERGDGPFGAQLALYDANTGEYEKIGTIAANAVPSTGVASAHAEDQALQPQNVEALDFKLEIWKMLKRDATVIFASSGQNCQSCHAKGEIVAENLVRRELIKSNGGFVVVYGALFEDTAKIAGFNDEPYTLDLIRHDREPNSSYSMVRHHTMWSATLPPDVAALFKNTKEQVAAVVRDGKILSIGHDHRHLSDFISTAEVEAIRDACRDQHKTGIKEPWLLGDPNRLAPDPHRMASLYTTTTQIGALMRGEAMWAAINEIVTVIPQKGVQRETQEAPLLGNRQFLHSMAMGYNHGASVLTVFHDPLFENKAQHVWAEKLEREGKKILYNGIGADSDLNRFAKMGSERFTGLALA